MIGLAELEARFAQVRIDLDRLAQDDDGFRRLPLLEISPAFGEVIVRRLAAGRRQQRGGRRQESTEGRG